MLRNTDTQAAEAGWQRHGEVTTEDYFHALAMLDEGISATFAFPSLPGAQKCPQGEIYGSKGGMIYTLEKGVDSLKLCLGEEQNIAGLWTEVDLDRNVAGQMDCFGEILRRQQCNPCNH